MAVRLTLGRNPPAEAAGAGGGRGLLGRGGERALVLLAERVDGRVIVGGGVAAALGGGLGADRLQTGAAGEGKQKNRKGLDPSVKWHYTRPEGLMNVTGDKLLR